MKGSTAAVLGVAAVIIAVLVVTVVLAWHGTLNGQAAEGIISVVLAGVIGTGAHAAGSASATATAPPPPVAPETTTSSS